MRGTLDPPYMLQGLHRAKIISAVHVPETIAARHPFKASHMEGEWRETRQGSVYIVWFRERGVMMLYHKGYDEWFAVSPEAFRHKAFNRREPFKRLYERIIDRIQPTILESMALVSVMAVRGKEGVVRKMMGLD